MPTTNAPLNDDLWLREMPEPLAELYEQLCNSTPDQRFERLRKLGEMAVHFATIIALANAATGSAIPVEYSSWVRALVPLNIGNSLRILGEALRKSSSDFCPELRAWFGNPATVKALDRLRVDRNDAKHDRGAEGRLAVRQAGEDLATHLLPALAGLEFLAEYSLGYLESCEARRGGGWHGEWHGWRGARRQDDDGAIAGLAANSLPPLEVLLVDPTGQRALTLPPLLAAVPFGKRVQLAILVKVANSAESAAKGMYAQPSDLTKELSHAVDADDGTATWASYAQAPQKWHAVRKLQLDTESLQRIRGLRHVAKSQSRLKLGQPAPGPRGQRGWVAENLDDGRKVLAFPLPAKFASDVSARGKAVDALRRLTEPGLPRFLALEPSDRSYMLTFEHVSGQRLSSWLADRGSMAPHDAAVQVLGLLESLAEAHGAGLWHGAVAPENLVVSASGRLRLLQPLLLPDEVGDATTRQSLQLVDAVGAPILASDFGLDVAGVAATIARMCGVAYRVGQRPPDLAYQAAATSRPLALWFDRAARRSWSLDPFADAGQALVALREALGGPSVAARAMSAPMAVAQLETETRQEQVVAGPAVDEPPLSVGVSPSPRRGRSFRGPLTIVFALLAVVVALLMWWSSKRGVVAGAASAAPSDFAAAGPPHAPPVAAPAPVAPAVGPAWDSPQWEAFSTILPNASTVREAGEKMGRSSVADLLAVPANYLDCSASTESDVRPGQYPCKWKDDNRKQPRANPERKGKELARLGCAAMHGASECRGLVGKLPTGATATWTLKCGGEQRWYAVDGAWLLVYMTAGEADCEWWLYPHDASADKLEREIADAYSCNDAAALAWEGKRPEEALKLYESAVQILSIYSKAACRGCAVSRFLGREDAKLCATGAKSNNSSTKKKSKGREQLPKLGATLCP